ARLAHTERFEAGAHDRGRAVAEGHAFVVGLARHPVRVLANRVHAHEIGFAISRGRAALPVRRERGAADAARTGALPGTVGVLLARASFVARRAARAVAADEPFAT